MRRCLNLVFGLVISGLLYAPAYSQGYDLSTPVGAILVHYDNMMNKPQDITKSATALYQGDLSQEEIEDLAVKLYRFYVAEGKWLDADKVPSDPNFVDSTLGKNEYHPFPRHPEIYLKKYGKQWLYSEFTVNHIEQLYRQAYPLGEDRLLDYVPKSLKREFLGLEIWKYIAILLIAILGSILYYSVSFLLKNWIVRILRKFPAISGASKLVIRVARPLSFVLVVALINLFLPLLQLPALLNHYLVILLDAFFPLLITIISYRVVDLGSGYFEELSRKTDSSLDDQLVPLLRKVVKSVIIIIGTIFVLISLEINVVPLLTGLSIGGLAFALAAQDTIKNFFGSIMIFIDKPFQIGDWIVADSIDGEVEEVGLRSTRVRTFKNSVTYVPNGKIADSIIENYGLRAYRRMNIKIGLTYDTPPELVQAFVQGLEKMVMEHPSTWKDKKEIHFNNLGESSLVIMFYIFFQVPNWHEELNARHDVLLKIMKLAKALGVSFAFPTQTLHIQDLPGQASLNPSYDTDPASINQRLDSFFKESNNEDRN